MKLPTVRPRSCAAYLDGKPVYFDRDGLAHTRDDLLTTAARLQAHLETSTDAFLSRFYRQAIEDRMGFIKAIDELEETHADR